jgi:CRISPR-associated protein Cmr1
MNRIISLKLQFHTPAFVGDAEQNGVWRTPPIKALLRQFWRMGYASRQAWRVDIPTMRQEEGKLFGTAFDESRRSEIRVRLDRWDDGKLKSWARLETQSISHPEVPSRVGPQLYLGYGPLKFERGSGTALKGSAAIQANESANLRISAPDDGGSAIAIHHALALMHRFGTLGGRSRNGWGSFSLTGSEGKPLQSTALPTRDWREALALDWPHAIGSDGRGPLVWELAGMADWQRVMKRLAEIKIGFRTLFTFTRGRSSNPEQRDWLSYPVTNHAVSAWKLNARLPNSLRFKVRKSVDGLCGTIFHVPCRPPAEFKPDKESIESVWQQVHEYLDAQPDLRRSQEGTAP